MLYRIFKWLFARTIAGYFQSISIKGREKIPETGPVIFVANHNSAFMDPIVLAVHIERPLYFLARGESFTSTFKSKFFNLLNMIPIYRPEICPDEVYKNEEVFQNCYLHLSNGKTLLIFPEGFSKTVRELRPLKTGTARMALEAEHRNEFQLGLQVVPIGINYSNPHRFRSHVFLNIGDPIDVRQYKELYRSKPKEAVTSFTDDVANRLENLLVVIKDDRLYELIEQIETLYFNNLTMESIEANKGEQRFELSKVIARVVQYFAEYHPIKLKQFQKRIEEYFQKLHRLNLRDTQLSYLEMPTGVYSDLLYLILGALLCVYGILVNLLPFKLVSLLSSRMKVREDFEGSKKLALGMFTFLIIYVMQSLLAAWFINWYWAVFMLLSFFPSGLFSLEFLKRLQVFKHQYRYKRLYKDSKMILEELKSHRRSLLEDWENYQESYRKSLHDKK